VMNRESLLRFFDKIALVSFVLLAFFIPTSNSAIEICFGIILSCFVIRMILKRPRLEDIKGFFSNKINLSLLVFFVFIGFSLFASGDLFGKSFYAWTCKWGERVLLFCFAQVFLSKKHVKMILAVFLFTAFISSLSGLWQKITGYDFLRGFEAIGTGGFAAIRSTFNHSNDFAVFLTTIFFILCGFMMQEKKKIIRSVLLGLSGLLIVNLWFTYSRGGWLTFFLTLLLFAVLSDRRVRFASFLFFIFMAAGLIFLPVARERILITFQPGGDMSRIALWTGAFSMFRSSPVIGTGIGLFMDRLPEYSDHVGQYAHNSYLQILAETGILGLGAFLWFLFELISEACKKLKERREPMLMGVLLAATVFLIHSFFDTHFYSLRLSMFFWMLAGMVSVYCLDKNRKDICNLSVDERL
jgi:putative inorganic carbon (hco3(-)) transporter